MARVTEAEVRQALANVAGLDPAQVKGLTVRDGNVGFALEVDPARGAALEPLRKAAEAAVDALPGVLSVTAVLTAHDAAPAQPRQQPQPQQPRPQQATAQGQQQAGGANKMALENIGAVVAVASGKGGVGKSTTAVNLALGLSQLGLKVGILDADIYGPSLPRMLGLSGKPDSDGKRLQPMRNHGVVCMSIGFLVDADTPMIWRGPMVMSALEQMLRDVEWGELDVLVVDMPPGTGDAQLTMAQRVPLAGAVIVSTPQDIALLDARRGLFMFQRVEVPVLGLIENMSYFVCPHCGERSEIFGHGGARQTAQELGMDFLGEVPLHIAIRETSDAGTPIVITDPASPHAQAYMAIAAEVAGRLESAGNRRMPPKIVID